MVQNSTQNHVAMPIETEVTMTDADDDSGPFIPVEPPKANKKTKLNHVEAACIEHVYEMDLRITFSLPAKPSTKFNVNVSTKNLFLAMLHHDATLAIQAADTTLYLANDTFPTNEQEFTKFFNVHAPTSHPKRKNQVVIGCKVRSNRTIQDIKKATNDKNNMMTWLQNNYVYLESDSLGITKVRTVGYLFNVHPRIIQRSTFKTTLYDALEAIKITNNEVIALDPDAQRYYNENDGDTFVPPFELYKTTIGHGSSSNKRVVTDTVAIKGNIEHANLLQELFIRAHQSPNIALPSKFVPAGISATIGAEAYTTMICNNNQYLSNIATIPVVGITETMLNLDIEVYDPVVKTKLKKLRAVLTSTHWCQSIEVTQVEARILMITTKANLAEGRKWLDANLPILYTRCLKNNPKFIPDIDNPIPKRPDKREQTTAYATYADIMKRDIINGGNTNDTVPRYAKPPKTHTSRPLPYSYEPTEFPTIQTNTPTATATNSTSITETIKNTITNPEHKTTPPTLNITTTSPLNSPTTISDIAALKQSITNDIRAEIATQVQQQIQHELRPFRQELQASSAATTAQFATMATTLMQIQLSLAALLPTPSSSQNGDGMH